MTDRPYKPFNDAVQGKQPDKEPQDHDAKHIRDQDNAKPMLKPDMAKLPAFNLAPPGMKGVQRNLPTPEHQKAKEDFKLTGPGDLKREFKPVARGIDKDHGHER